jgi:hypothetical protein
LVSVQAPVGLSGFSHRDPRLPPGVLFKPEAPVIALFVHPTFLMAAFLAATSALVEPTPWSLLVEGRPGGHLVLSGARTHASPPDSAALLREARTAQASFERRRVSYLPLTDRSGGKECDERIGRMCLRFGAGSDWEPAPEREEVRALRQDLLDILDRVGSTLPGDDWVLGQRVHYLGEAELWSEAEELVRRCGGVTTWRCSALLGYVLHRQERYVEAEGAFQGAMEAMPEERAREWRDLERLLDTEGARLYRRLEGEERRALEGRIWSLANPLLLVPGNDRRTEHFARHVEAEIRSNARNPYNLRWGRDLAEIHVRYGAEYGWERERPGWNPQEAPRVVGRFHPRGRGFLPPGKYLQDPSSLPLGEWTVDERRVRARHAPAYAPRIHALEPQVARFRRGDSVFAVASWRVAAFQDFDTAPWMPPPEGEYRSGLFLIPVGPEAGSVPPPEVPSSLAQTGIRGLLTLTAPPGEWVLSVETLHPEAKRAWRARMGLPTESLPQGVVALSDLLLTEPPPGDLAVELGDVVEGALPGSEIPRGAGLGVAWEVYGLTRTDGELRFRITVGRADRGLLRRAGERMGLLEPEPPLVLSWEEGGADPPGPLFRSVTLDLAALDPGEYELRLELDLTGRTPAVARRVIRIEEGYP